MRLSEERARIALNEIPVTMSVWRAFSVEEEGQAKMLTTFDTGYRALLLIALTMNVMTTQVV